MIKLGPGGFLNVGESSLLVKYPRLMLFGLCIQQLQELHGLLGRYSGAGGGGGAQIRTASNLPRPRLAQARLSNCRAREFPLYDGRARRSRIATFLHVHDEKHLATGGGLREAHSVHCTSARVPDSQLAQFEYPGLWT